MVTAKLVRSLTNCNVIQGCCVRGRAKHQLCAQSPPHPPPAGRPPAISRQILLTAPLNHFNPAHHRPPHAVVTIFHSASTSSPSAGHAWSHGGQRRARQSRPHALYSRCGDAPLVHVGEAMLSCVLNQFSVLIVSFVTLLTAGS